MLAEKKISKKDLWFGKDFPEKLITIPEFYIIVFLTLGAFIFSVYFLLRFIKSNEIIFLILSVILFALVLIEIFFGVFKKKRFFVDW